MLGISVCFPHAMNPENDRVLQLSLQMLDENTTCAWEPLILLNKGRPDLVYPGWDWLMRNAKYDLILWMNSDILMGPGWDVNVLKHKDDADWVGIELVECGAIGVHPNNIHRDFGRTAASFDRRSFESFCLQEMSKRPSMREGFCWYSPSVWKKDWYEKTGGFPMENSFPHPNDSIFRTRLEKSGECKFIVANSFAYHLQRARENMGQKEDRC